MTVRLRDKNTGVVIQVDEETAKRISASHEPADVSGVPELKASRPRTVKK